MGDNGQNRSIPLLLWPFYALWQLLTLILEITGRIICAFLGLALMAVGVMITISIVAAPIGIPMAAIGFLLLIRAFF